MHILDISRHHTFSKTTDLSRMIVVPGGTASKGITHTQDASCRTAQEKELSYVVLESCVLFDTSFLVRTSEVLIWYGCGR